MTEEQYVSGAYSTTAVQYRNMVVQILLIIVTFGLYGIYWFFVTGRELQYLAQDPEASPGLWTVIGFIPFGTLYSFYKYSELYTKWNKGRYELWLIYILWLFFSPAVWFLVQSDLNKVATTGRPTQG